MNNKRNKIIIIILICIVFSIQTIISIVFGTVLVFLNVLQVLEGGEEKLNNLEEQKELLDSGFGFMLFGLWNYLFLDHIDERIEKIKRDFNPLDLLFN